MYSPNADALAVKARALVGEARRADGGSQQDLDELQHTVGALVEAAFHADDWLGTPENRRTVEALLFLVGEILADPAASPLCECGVRSAALVLQSVPFGVAQICSQEANQASACGMRVIDTCLAKLVDVCDEAERLVAACAKTPTTVADAEAAAAMRLALTCAEGIGASLEKLSPGEDGLLKSQAIWKSALEDTSAIASYLAKAFECACRLFAHCASAEMRRRPQLAAQATSLYRASGKVMDLVSTVFSSDAHLASDAGRKRSLMERYCTSTLAAHKTILGSPPQFKAAWKALCMVATSFSAVAFDGPGLCLKVYAQSCGMVRTLTAQAVALLRRTGDSIDPKLQRRVKGNLAFVRFIVFQMPSLMARIRSADAADAERSMAVFPDAMSMLDAVFGELMAEHMRVSVSGELSSLIHQLVATVCEKFAVSLLTAFPQSIPRYLDALWDHSFSAASTLERGQSIPYMEGIRHAAANREILRIAVSNIGVFTAAHQEQLLTHPVPILTALAMAADCDVVSVFAATKGAGSIHNEQQLAASEYEQLACAVALCAARVASQELFGHWETAALQTVCQAPPGSVGACAVADAWGLLSTTDLPQDAALSTVCGILEATAADPRRVSETGRLLLCQIVLCFAAKCADDDLASPLADMCRRAVEQSNPARIRVLCEVFPWYKYSPPSAVYGAGQGLLGSVTALLGSCGSIAERSDMVAGMGALAPIIQSDAALAASSGAWGHARLLLGEALGLGTGVDMTDRQRAAESALLLASSLPSSGHAGPADLLELCAQNVASDILVQARPAFLLARFAGGFATADLLHPSMEPVLAGLRTVFGHLLGEDTPWIARHQAHLQIIRFATESANQSVAEALVPEDQQASLLRFIQHEPGGAEMRTADEREAMYRSIFASPGWRASVYGSKQANGHANGKPPGLPDSAQPLLDAIGVLRWQLETTSREAMSPGASEAVREELAQLARAIEHFR